MGVRRRGLEWRWEENRREGTIKKSGKQHNEEGKAKRKEESIYFKEDQRKREGWKERKEIKEGERQRKRN